MRNSPEISARPEPPPEPHESEPVAAGSPAARDDRGAAGDAARAVRPVTLMYAERNRVGTAREADDTDATDAPLLGFVRGEATVRSPAVMRQEAARRRRRVQDTQVAQRTPVRLRWDAQAGAVAGMAALIGGVATAFAASQNAILWYVDARSHLEIARRVVDNRDPGLVQLGTVWLPVPHILLLPFVNIDPLWHSGLAGSIVGAACFVVTVVTLFLSVRTLTGRVLPAWIAAAVLLTNPSLLYIQTTALTEPVLLMSMTASAYFLLRWVREHETTHLTLAGMLAALAVGSRYDGWFFTIISLAVIALTVLLRTRRWSQAQGIVITYGAIPCYCMVLWFVYNGIFFGDPLAFQRGDFSAQVQQRDFEATGRLATKGDILLSSVKYFWSLMANAGWVVIAVAAVGLAVYVATTRFRADSFVPYVFLAPILFNVIALYLGQTIIEVPPISPNSFFNVRYGVVALPGLALFIGYLSSRLVTSKWKVVALPCFAGLLALQAALWVPDFPRSVHVLSEGYVSWESDQPLYDAAAYLREEYRSGGILIDEASARMITYTRIPMREYTGLFSGDRWNAALANPVPVVKYIIATGDPQRDTGDRVRRAANDNPAFLAGYDAVLTNDKVTIYRRKAGLFP